MVPTVYSTVLFRLFFMVNVPVSPFGQHWQILPIVALALPCAHVRLSQGFCCSQLAKASSRDKKSRFFIGLCIGLVCKFTKTLPKKLKTIFLFRNDVSTDIYGSTK